MASNKVRCVTVEIFITTWLLVGGRIGYESRYFTITQFDNGKTTAKIGFGLDSILAESHDHVELLGLLSVLMRKDADNTQFIVHLASTANCAALWFPGGNGPNCDLVTEIHAVLRGRDCSFKVTPFPFQSAQGLVLDKTVIEMAMRRDLQLWNDMRNVWAEPFLNEMPLFS